MTESPEGMTPSPEGVTPSPEDVTPSPEDVTPSLKRVTRGTHRLRAPGEMLASVRPLLPLAGITRLANITGLDRIGIPVVVGVRPNGRTLSQAAGKGVTLELALLSAAMEAIELFHAEVASVPQVYASYVELARTHAVIPLHDLPLSRHSVFSPLTPERWAFGQNLMTEARSVVAVPLDMVILPLRAERISHAGLFSFQTTSNGLASGCAFVEALAVGLLEVIERDAIACWAGRPAPRVRLDSARDFPLASEVLDKLEQARVHAIVYACTVDTEVPVYRAVLYDAAERRVGLAEGWGAHLDTELALVRALTEAAQSRAVAIAGARDDRFGRDIARLRLTDSVSRIAQLEAQPATSDLRDNASHAAPTFEADVQRLLARLAHVGVTQAIAIDLTLPAFRDMLSVVRVIVPQLGGPGIEPAPRATAFAAQRSAGEHGPSGTAFAAQRSASEHGPSATGFVAQRSASEHDMSATAFAAQHGSIEHAPRATAFAAQHSAVEQSPSGTAFAAQRSAVEHGPSANDFGARNRSAS